MNAREALLSVVEVVKNFGDQKAIGSYYLEFSRRLEVLRHVEEHCRPGSTILDLGAQPFILSCALRRMGYNVIAFDIEPETYRKIAEACDINVISCDLEKDDPGVSNAECIVFTEVLEHLHYYYVPIVLNKINKALRREGVLILTTPNIASLFRRIKLLLGIQPIYRYHVREYTMNEILSVLREAGFEIMKAYYSIVNDLAFINAEPDDYLRISRFKEMLGIALKKPTKLNILRILAYPIVKLKPDTRQLMVIIAKKIKEQSLQNLERWG
jgi:2-polyprenyl-3-methyl-5-hydroxy-6-metoxy-1,4-benzoquinol methylase